MQVLLGISLLVIAAVTVLLNPSPVWPVGQWLMAGGFLLAAAGIAVYRWLMPDFIWAQVAIAIGVVFAFIGLFGAVAFYAAQHLHWA